jgi:hypothetical protein
VFPVKHGHHPHINSKAVPVTGRGGPWVCEVSRLPHCLEIQLTDCGEVVSLTLQPA